MIKHFPINFVLELYRESGPRANYRGGFVTKDFCCLVKKHVHCLQCDKAYSLQEWVWIYMCASCWNSLPKNKRDTIEGSRNVDGTFKEYYW